MAKRMENEMRTNIWVVIGGHMVCLGLRLNLMFVVTCC